MQGRRDKTCFIQPVGIPRLSCGSPCSAVTKASDWLSSPVTRKRMIGIRRLLLKLIGEWQDACHWLHAPSQPRSPRALTWRKSYAPPERLRYLPSRATQWMFATCTVAATARRKMPNADCAACPSAGASTPAKERAARVVHPTFTPRHACGTSLAVLCAAPPFPWSRTMNSKMHVVRTSGQLCATTSLLAFELPGATRAPRS